jgi:hypothetical protein
VFADDEAYTAATDARRRALRAKVHLHSSALFSGQRRVFLAQRHNEVARSRRALKRRLRRVRPKTKFRYFGVFGKRRRRVERRDKSQLMRLVVATRRRVAVRSKTRDLRTKVRTDTLRAQRSLIYTAAQAPHVAGVTTSSQLLRLLRGSASKRLEVVTRRYQRRRLLANASVSRKKGLNTLPVTSKASVAVNPAVGGVSAPGVQKKHKEAHRAFLKGRLSPLSRALRPRFGAAAGISLPFRRSLRRTKTLFIGRSPAASKRVVEPPQGSRKY